MNHSSSVPARVLVHEDFSQADQPGDVLLFGNGKYLGFTCPCGCGTQISIPISGERGWQLRDGSEGLTLHPSVRRMDKCNWHGHLVNGVWIPCGDSGA